MLRDHLSPGAPLTGGTPPVPTAHAAAYPPHRGRGRHLLIVASCPHCSAAHALRPVDLAATVDRRCPVTGSRYAALVDLAGVPDAA